LIFDQLLHRRIDKVTHRNQHVFAEKYAAKHDKAVECLTKDRDTRLALYSFPPEHWDHLRTTNPIESVFATVRAQDGARQNLAVVDDRQVDGVQAALRHIEVLAAPERHKSVAEGHRRCHPFQRPHRRRVNLAK
jgi:Transposase, Mutator family